MIERNGQNDKSRLSGEATGAFLRKGALPSVAAQRARLLEAPYDVMAEIGVDAAKIKDITDRADVGLGTFYNYFETKTNQSSVGLRD